MEIKTSHKSNKVKPGKIDLNLKNGVGSSEILINTYYFNKIKFLHDIRNKY